MTSAMVTACAAVVDAVDTDVAFTAPCLSVVMVVSPCSIWTAIGFKQSVTG